MTDQTPPPHSNGAPASALATPATPARESRAETNLESNGFTAREGTILGERYLLERFLGEGGMGAVYQGVHVHMKKRVAVKMLHPEMGRIPEVVARFEREAMAAANIDHPNVAAATDFGKLPEGGFYLVLEFIDGESLTERIDGLSRRGQRLTLRQVVHVARQILLALVRAHGLGIVHRDLKPDNVMLVEKEGDRDFVKVLDFGIAKVPVGDPAFDAGPKSAKAQPLTRAGMIYGTPEYMAPEQALGEEIDARADLYALGIMLHEMIAGKRPFEAENKALLLGMHVTTKAPSIAYQAPDRILPAPLVALVDSCLEKAPSARPESAAAALAVFDDLLAEPGTLVDQIRETPLHPGSEPSISFRENLGSARTVAARIAEDPALSVAHAPALRPRSEQAKLSPLLLGIPVVGLAALLVFALVASPSHKKQHLADGGTPDAAPVAAVDPAFADVDAAGELAKTGDAKGAIALLKKKPISGTDAGRGYRLLASLQASAGNGKGAIEAAEKAVAANSALAGDTGFLTALEPIGATQDAGDLVQFITLHPTPAGLDLIYRLSVVKGPGANAAWNVLATGAFDEKMSPALRIAVNLRKIGVSCKTKDFVIAAKDDGDARSLPFLEKMTTARTTGKSGFLGLGKGTDYLACLHKEPLVDDAIRAIKGRDPDAGGAPSKP